MGISAVLCLCVAVASATALLCRWVLQGQGFKSLQQAAQALLYGLHQHAAKLQRKQRPSLQALLAQHPKGPWWLKQGMGPQRARLAQLHCARLAVALGLHRQLTRPSHRRRLRYARHNARHAEVGTTLLSPQEPTPDAAQSAPVEVQPGTPQVHLQEEQQPQPVHEEAANSSGEPPAPSSSTRRTLTRSTSEGVRRKSVAWASELESGPTGSVLAALEEAEAAGGGGGREDGQAKAGRPALSQRGQPLLPVAPVPNRSSSGLLGSSEQTQVLRKVLSRSAGRANFAVVAAANRVLANHQLQQQAAAAESEPQPSRQLIPAAVGGRPVVGGVQVDSRRSSPSHAQRRHSVHFSTQHHDDSSDASSGSRRASRSESGNDPNGNAHFLAAAAASLMMLEAPKSVTSSSSPGQGQQAGPGARMITSASKHSLSGRSISSLADSALFPASVNGSELSLALDASLMRGHISRNGLRTGMRSEAGGTVSARQSAAGGPDMSIDLTALDTPPSNSGSTSTRRAASPPSMGPGALTQASHAPSSSGAAGPQAGPSQAQGTLPAAAAAVTAAAVAAVALLDQDSALSSSIATIPEMEAEEAAADLAFGLANAWRSSLPVQLMSVMDEHSMLVTGFHRSGSRSLTQLPDMWPSDHAAEAHLGQSRGQGLGDRGGGGPHLMTGDFHSRRGSVDRGRAGGGARSGSATPSGSTPNTSSGTTPLLHAATALAAQQQGQEDKALLSVAAGAASEVGGLPLPRQASSPAAGEPEEPADPSTSAQPPGEVRSSRAFRTPPSRSYTHSQLRTQPTPQGAPHAVATVLQTATSVARADSQDSHQWEPQGITSKNSGGQLSTSSRQLRKVMSSCQQQRSSLAPGSQGGGTHLLGVAGPGPGRSSRPPSTAGPGWGGDWGELSAAGGSSSSPHSSHASGLPAVAAMLQALRVSTGTSKTFLGTMLGAQLSASGSTKAGSPSSCAVPSTGRTRRSVDGPAGFEEGLHRAAGQQGSGESSSDAWPPLHEHLRAAAPALSTIATEGRGGSEDAYAFLARVSGASTSTTSQWQAATGHCSPSHPTVAALSFSDTLQGGGKGRMRVLLVSADPGKVQAIRAALPARRYAVSASESAAQCLQGLMSGRALPDCLLLDSALSSSPAAAGGGEAAGIHPQAPSLSPRASGSEYGHALLPSQASGDFESVGRSSGGHQQWLLQSHQRRGSSTGQSAINILQSQYQQLPPGHTPMTAMQLLDSIRNAHDPAVLPVIMLVSPPASATTHSAQQLQQQAGEGNEAAQAKGGSPSPTPDASLHGPAATPFSTVQAAMQVSTNGSIIAPSASLGWTPLASAKAGVSALKRGANDYVMFPVLPLELEARIHMQVALRRAVRLKADASSSMALLRAMLPEHVIRKLKTQGMSSYITQYHDQVTVAFIDVVGFTDLCSVSAASRVAQMLNELFQRFDDVCDKHGVVHIDTIGDGYMVACGLEGEPDHALRMIRAAADMIDATRTPLSTGDSVAVRVGINTGPTHSGVLSTKRLKYTLWGDSVNTASRMESSGFPACVQVSKMTFKAAMAQMESQARSRDRAGVTLAAGAPDGGGLGGVAPPFSGHASLDRSSPATVNSRSSIPHGAGMYGSGHLTPLSTTTDLAVTPEAQGGPGGAQAGAGGGGPSGPQAPAAAAQHLPGFPGFGSASSRPSLGTLALLASLRSSKNSRLGVDSSVDGRTSDSPRQSPLSCRLPPQLQAPVPSASSGLVSTPGVAQGSGSGCSGAGGGGAGGAGTGGTNSQGSVHCQWLDALEHSSTQQGHSSGSTKGGGGSGRAHDGSGDTLRQQHMARYFRRNSAPGGEGPLSSAGQGSGDLTPHASEALRPDYEFEFVELGLRHVKGKGLLATYLVKVGDWQEAVEYWRTQPSMPPAQSCRFLGGWPGAVDELMGDESEGEEEQGGQYQQGTEHRQGGMQDAQHVGGGDLRTHQQQEQVPTRLGARSRDLVISGATAGGTANFMQHPGLRMQGQGEGQSVRFKLGVVQEARVGQPVMAAGATSAHRSSRSAAGSEVTPSVSDSSTPHSSLTPTSTPLPAGLSGTRAPAAVAGRQEDTSSSTQQQQQQGGSLSVAQLRTPSAQHDSGFASALRKHLTVAGMSLSLTTGGSGSKKSVDGHSGEHSAPLPAFVRSSAPALEPSIFGRLSAGAGGDAKGKSKGKKVMAVLKSAARKLLQKRPSGTKPSKSSRALENVTSTGPSMTTPTKPHASLEMGSSSAAAIGATDLASAPASRPVLSLLLPPPPPTLHSTRQGSSSSTQHPHHQPHPQGLSFTGAWSPATPPQPQPQPFHTFEQSDSATSTAPPPALATAPAAAGATAAGAEQLDQDDIHHHAEGTQQPRSPLPVTVAIDEAHTQGDATATVAAPSGAAQDEAGSDFLTAPTGVKLTVRVAPRAGGGGGGGGSTAQGQQRASRHAGRSLEMPSSSSSSRARQESQGLASSIRRSLEMLRAQQEWASIRQQAADRAQGQQEAHARHHQHKHAQGGGTARGDEGGNRKSQEVQDEEEQQMLIDLGLHHLLPPHQRSAHSTAITPVSQAQLQALIKARATAPAKVVSPPQGLGRRSRSARWGEDAAAARLGAVTPSRLARASAAGILRSAPQSSLTSHSPPRAHTEQQSSHPHRPPPRVAPTPGSALPAGGPAGGAGTDLNTPGPATCYALLSDVSPQPSVAQVPPSPQVPPLHVVGRSRLSQTDGRPLTTSAPDSPGSSPSGAAHPGAGGPGRLLSLPSGRAGSTGSGTPTPRLPSSVYAPPSLAHYLGSPAHMSAFLSADPNGSQTGSALTTAVLATLHASLHMSPHESNDTHT